MSQQYPYIARSNQGHIVLVGKRSAIILKNPDDRPLTGNGWSFTGPFVQYVAPDAESYIHWLEKEGIFLPLLPGDNDFFQPPVMVPQNADIRPE